MNFATMIRLWLEEVGPVDGGAHFSLAGEGAKPWVGGQLKFAGWAGRLAVPTDGRAERREGASGEADGATAVGDC